MFNDDRRHLTRADRVEWVRKLREKGMSTRAIADAVGVSDITVRRDLKQTGGTYVPPESTLKRAEQEPDEQDQGQDEPTPAPEPPKVTGLDGKRRRRLAAVKKLGWERVPVRIVETLDDAISALLAEEQENTCREDLSPHRDHAGGAADRGHREGTRQTSQT